MKHLKSHLILALGLIFCSFVFYFIHYKVFHDLHHLFIYMVGDIAFLFIEVLIVSLIIERLLHINEKRSRMEKLNMIIGAFFSEAGTPLLKILSKADKNRNSLHDYLSVVISSRREFKTNAGEIKTLNNSIEVNNIDLNDLKVFLLEKRNFMLRMLENPSLMEHEAFSDVLWSVFHLAEELKSRESLSHLPQSDCDHLKGDINRVYRRLILQWINYMMHLKKSYPYLFSLALRTSPFNRNASALVFSAS